MQQRRDSTDRSSVRSGSPERHTVPDTPAGPPPSGGRSGRGSPPRPTPVRRPLTSELGSLLGAPFELAYITCFACEVTAAHASDCPLREEFPTRVMIKEPTGDIMAALLREVFPNRPLAGRRFSHPRLRAFSHTPRGLYHLEEERKLYWEKFDAETEAAVIPPPPPSDGPLTGIRALRQLRGRSRDASTPIYQDADAVDDGAAVMPPNEFIRAEDPGLTWATQVEQGADMWETYNRCTNIIAGASFHTAEQVDYARMFLALCADLPLEDEAETSMGEPPIPLNGDSTRMMGHGRGRRAEQCVYRPEFGLASPRRPRSPGDIITPNQDRYEEYRMTVTRSEAREDREQAERMADLHMGVYQSVNYLPPDSFFTGTVFPTVQAAKEHYLASNAHIQREHLVRNNMIMLGHRRLQRIRQSQAANDDEAPRAHIPLRELSARQQLQLRRDAEHRALRQQLADAQAEIELQRQRQQAYDCRNAQVEADRMFANELVGRELQAHKERVAEQAKLEEERLAEQQRLLQEREKENEEGRRRLQESLARLEAEQRATNERLRAMSEGSLRGSAGSATAAAGAPGDSPGGDDHRRRGDDWHHQRRGGRDDSWRRSPDERRRRDGREDGQRSAGSRGMPGSSTLSPSDLHHREDRSRVHGYGRSGPPSSYNGGGPRRTNSRVSTVSFDDNPGSAVLPPNYHDESRQRAARMMEENPLFRAQLDSALIESVPMFDGRKQNYQHWITKLLAIRPSLSEERFREVLLQRLGPEPTNWLATVIDRHSSTNELLAELRDNYDEFAEPMRAHNEFLSLTQDSRSLDEHHTNLRRYLSGMRKDTDTTDPLILSRYVNSLAHSGMRRELHKAMDGNPYISLRQLMDKARRHERVEKRCRASPFVPSRRAAPATVSAAAVSQVAETAPAVAAAATPAAPAAAEHVADSLDGEAVECAKAFLKSFKKVAKRTGNQGNDGPPSKGVKQNNQPTDANIWCPIHETSRHDLSCCRLQDSTSCQFCKATFNKGEAATHHRVCKADRCATCRKRGHEAARCYRNNNGRPKPASKSVATATAAEMTSSDDSDH